MRSLGRGVCAPRRRGRAPGQRLQVPGRMVRAGAEWSHAGAEGARAGAEHVSLPETGIRNSYAPEVHYTLTSHREALGLTRPGPVHYVHRGIVLRAVEEGMLWCVPCS